MPRDINLQWICRYILGVTGNLCDGYGRGRYRKGTLDRWKTKSLAHLLEMGLYMEASPEWDLAVTNKDKDKALDILAEMVYGVKA